MQAAHVYVMESATNAHPFKQHAHAPHLASWGSIASHAPLRQRDACNAPRSASCGPHACMNTIQACRQAAAGRVRARMHACTRAQDAQGSPHVWGKGGSSHMPNSLCTQSLSLRPQTAQFASLVAARSSRPGANVKWSNIRPIPLDGRAGWRGGGEAQNHACLTVYRQRQSAGAGCKGACNRALCTGERKKRGGGRQRSIQTRRPEVPPSKARQKPKLHRCGPMATFMDA